MGAKGRNRRKWRQWGGKGEAREFIEEGEWGRQQVEGVKGGGEEGGKNDWGEEGERGKKYDKNHDLSHLLDMEIYENGKYEDYVREREKKRKRQK